MPRLKLTKMRIFVKDRFSELTQYILNIPENLGRYPNDELSEVCQTYSNLRIEQNANYEHNLYVI